MSFQTGEENSAVAKGYHNTLGIVGRQAGIPRTTPFANPAERLLGISLFVVGVISGD